MGVKARLSFEGSTEESSVACSENACVSGGCGVSGGGHTHLNGGTATRKYQVTGNGTIVTPSDSMARKELEAEGSKGVCLLKVGEVEGAGSAGFEKVQGTVSEGVTEVEVEEKTEGALSEGVENTTSLIAAAGATNSINVSAPAITTGHAPQTPVDASTQRLRSSSASAAVRRVSMDQSLISVRSERLLLEKKRRRWSLNMPNHINNLPQVSAVG